MSRPWMPLYPADYLKDTTHLTTLQHGAYTLLIMNYWIKEKLPTDDKILARITGLSHREWLKIKPSIAEFFDENWRHSRVEKEMAKAKEKSEKRTDAGSRGAAVKALKIKEAHKAFAIANADVLLENRQSKPQANGSASSSDSTYEDKAEALPSIQKEASPPKSDAPAKPSPASKNSDRGSRLPKDWVVNEARVAFALGIGFAPSHAKRTGENFCAYWWAKAGANARKTDWDLVWQNWCRREAEEFSPQKSDNWHGSV